MTTIEERLLSGVKVDYKYADGVQDLTYYQTATGTTINNVKSLCYDVEQIEVRGAVTVKKTMRVWCVFANTLSVDPTPGDYVTDADGYSWTVQAVGTNRIKRKTVIYELKCVKRL